jgi:membrane associated rhomboid family serine protease
MTATPVGMRCPECARDRTRVTRGSAAFSGAGRAPAAMALIAINVVVFLIEIGSGTGGLSSTSGSVLNDFGLRGSSVAEGEWYRLLSGGFLHAGLLHLGFNMFALYIIGELLEPAIGTPRFLAVYFASLLAGSFGALLLTDPAQVTIGASGAIFGIFAATFVIARGRGLYGVASQLGILLLINLALTFGVRDLSIGGHLGGLVAGLLCGVLIVAGDRGRLGPNRLAAELVGIGAIGVISVAAALAVA